MPNQDLHLRSEEVQEILTRVPNWMIRWGNLVILVLLLLVFFISWMIKYPDIVTGEIIITTSTPPEKLIARNSGRFEKILVSNQQVIDKGIPLAIIENTARYQDVFTLINIVDSIKIDTKEIYFPFENLKNLQLGDISSAFSLFEKEYLDYKLNGQLKPYQVEGIAQNYEVIQLQQRLDLLLKQKDIGVKEQSIKKKEIERFKKLHDKGVIATQEFDSKNLEYLQFEKELMNLTSSISQLRSSINDLNKTVKTTKINETIDQVTLFRNTIQSYNQLKKAINDWELNYVLRSSIAGEVTFLQVWKENQSINSGDNIFSIIPRDEEKNTYLGKVKVVAQNSGKIKKGQKVNISLANYPNREFGIITGIVEYISLIPDKDGNLLIDISLPNGLKTSYKKNITFKQEMSGNVNIITEDLRLIERLLYQFRDLFSRTSEIKK